MQRAQKTRIIRLRTISVILTGGAKCRLEIAKGQLYLSYQNKRRQSSSYPTSSACKTRVIIKPSSMKTQAVSRPGSEVHPRKESNPLRGWFGRSRCPEDRIVLDHVFIGKNWISAVPCSDFTDYIAWQKKQIIRCDSPVRSFKLHTGFFTDPIGDGFWLPPLARRCV